MSGARLSVTRSAALVGALTGVSRILGLVREMLTAHLFGTSALQSAFVVAFTIPNLFRRLFGEGALSAAFVPAFAHSRAREGADDARHMARRVMTRVGALLAGIAVLGILLAAIAEGQVAPGSKTALTLPLLRIMLPYAPLICLTALCMGMLNVLGDFRTPAIAPTLLNLVWIGALIGVCFLLPDTPGPRITAVAAAIPLAGMLQFGLLWTALRRRGWTLLPEGGGAADPRVRQVWHKAIPAALGAGAVQINVCLDFLLAYWAADWAPSALTYADRILYLPMGVVATAYGTVLLPAFSSGFADNDLAGVRDTFRRSLSDLVLLMAPATVGLVLLAGPIVAVLYERGEFTAVGSMRTARALGCYAPGLLVFSLQKVLNPLFHGMGDTRTPMRVATAGVLLNLLLNLLFVLTWPVEWKHAGIATATVISSAAASFALVRIARRRVGPLGWSRIGASFGRALAASAVMGVAARRIWLAASGALQAAFPEAAGAARAGALALAVAGGAAVYAAALFLVSPNEARRLARRLRRRPRA